MHVPKWAKETIWYQIFPERFRNGNPDSDPRLEDIKGAYPHDLTSPFETHPWTSDWYELQEYEKKNGKDIWFNLQRRRYGGDLQGIIDKLDYLSTLGITGIYLNPVFDAPSSHKYDGRCYHHIDPTLGPCPEKDKETVKNEIPHDPSTWVMTEADRLMFLLIRKVHSKGMKIIFDGVFNHLGIDNVFFRDVLKRRKESIYRKWHSIRKYGRSRNPLKDWSYKSWENYRELPVIRQNKDGITEEPQKYIFASIKKWMCPEGKKENGIDGWRLDVAEKIAHPFWKKFRNYVRELNNDAYIVGEIFGDIEVIKPFLKGDEFDAVMNYNFTYQLMKYFIDGEITARKFNSNLKILRDSFDENVVRSAQNLLCSHDTTRISSHIHNRGKLKYSNWGEFGNLAKGENKDYSTAKPDKISLQIQKLLILFQMTYIGSPMIYYGDEAGMWGGNDPCCRKPMLWDDMIFEDSFTEPTGKKRKTGDRNEFNRELFDYYRKLIQIRKKYYSLTNGNFRKLIIKNDIYGFTRSHENEKIHVITNRSQKESRFRLENLKGDYEDLLTGDHFVSIGETELFLKPYSGIILREIS